MNRPTVLVTDAEYHRAAAVFQRQSDLDCVVAPGAEEHLAAAARASGARYVIVGHLPYRGPLYDALPAGGVIARFGVGHDGVDKTRATDAGLFCTNTPSVLDQSVAEFTIALVLAAVRHIADMAADMRAGRWQLRQGLELRSRRLAVIGCGQIGRAVARIATHGFGMHVTGCYRPGSVRPDGAAAEAFAATTDSFAEAVSAADVVSVHVPASAGNRHFIDASALALLPAHAWLINTARGSVVDEDALFDSLAARRLGGAALDVFEREPYVPGDPARDLRTLSNVVLTPHAGSHTAAANQGMAERALQNVRWAIAGEYGRLDLLNPAVLTSFPDKAQNAPLG